MKGASVGRAAGHPTGRVRPVDAAGLILLRGRRDAPEILLGRRHAKTAFLPDIYVVPGGRVDRADHLPSGFQERPHPAVTKSLSIGTARPPLAFLRAALRETHEETGLVIGGGKAARAVAPSADIWQAYMAAGAVPAFDGLDYILRAITPAGSPRRYNTRFFLGDGARAEGTLTGNGELLDLRWWPAAALERLNIVDVTWALIRIAMQRWQDRIAPGAQQPKLLTYKKDSLVLQDLPVRRA